ncbi:MAG: DUF1015 family protein [Acidobacteriota bacterium]
MVMVRPFRALRPPKERVELVAAVPYDVVNSEEARALAANNPWSLLHITRPEIDLSEDTNIYDNAVYAKAVENFFWLQNECPLNEEQQPSLYIYRLRMGEQVQTGVVGCCSIDEYDTDVIRKHERTRQDKEDDRTRHTVTLRVQTEPVFLTYRGQATIDTLVAQIVETEPLYDFVTVDGITHTLWRVPSCDALETAFRSVPLLYVADGHHRSASASRARAHLRGQNPQHGGEEEYNFLLAVMFPAEQLRIMPYNRVVRDLHGRSETDFLEAVKEHFIVSTNASPTPVRRGEFSMFLWDQWYGLVPKTAVDLENVITSLDVSVLQNRLLAPVLGIHDPRTDKRIDFVGGIRGTNELELLVTSRKFAVAFSLYPTTIEDLMRVADAGEIMPPKSTWFEPKLRSGLFMHAI